MATKKVQGAADGSTPDTTIVDETAKVEFGSDAWGTWAQGVQDRLTALEALIANSGANADGVDEQFKAISAELKALKGTAPANTPANRTSGGSDARLARIEQMMGITVELDEPAVVEDSEGTFGQEVSDEAKEGATDGT